MIKRAVLGAVELDAIACYAQEAEACGYLLGPAEQPLLCDEHVRMQNEANKYHERNPEEFPRTARTSFRFNEMRFGDVWRRSTAAGRPVKVLYHSHLDVGAYFSDTDAAAMNPMGLGPEFPLAYLVTSVRRGEDGSPHVDDHRLFVWDGASFVPSTFTVID
jgi:proteasome lid subunit RPN8/RPN11